MEVQIVRTLQDPSLVLVTVGILEMELCAKVCNVCFAFGHSVCTITVSFVALHYTLPYDL